MKRNVTVTLDEGTARWVRVEAAKNDMSVSQYLGELLADRRRRHEGYEAAWQRYMAREPRPLRRTGDRLPTRSEIHDRGRPERGRPEP